MIEPKSKISLTVITPVFNEEDVIAHYHTRTRGVLDSLPEIEAKILFVVDRCTDNTIDILRTIVANDPKSKVIALSSRFGHQMSLLAGIENSLDADALIMMDSDLQHPPELITQLIAKFKQGFDVVYTIRKDTEDIGIIRKTLGNSFYTFLSKITDIQINANSADFRLISRRVAKILANDFRERNMFLRGLFSWIGFKQISVEFIAERRLKGHSKYSFSKMLQLAMTGILSFSTKPLQLGILLGLGFSVIALILVVTFITRYFFIQTVPDGWTTMIVLLLFFCGLQLLVLGIIGVYIGNIYEEVKGRPRYLIEEIIPHPNK